MIKSKCDKCGYYFSKKGGNYTRHIKVCDGSYTPPGKRHHCKYCSKDFAHLTATQRANHTRWCDSNPKSSTYKNDLAYARSQITEKSIDKRAVSISLAHSNGKYDHVDRGTFRGRHHTEKTKQIIREKALASKHRRLKKKYSGI